MRALKTAVLLKSLTCCVFVWEQPVGQWSSVLYPPAAAVNELLIRGGSVTARLDQSFRWIHQSLLWQRHRADLHKLGHTQTGDQQGDKQLHPESQETVTSKVLLVFYDRDGSGVTFESGVGPNVSCSQTNNELILIVRIQTLMNVGVFCAH